MNDAEIRDVPDVPPEAPEGHDAYAGGERLIVYSTHSAADPRRPWTDACTIALYLSLKRGMSLVEIAEELNRDLPTIRARTLWLLTYLQKRGSAQLDRILRQRQEYRHLLYPMGFLLWQAIWLRIGWGATLLLSSSLLRLVGSV